MKRVHRRLHLMIRPIVWLVGPFGMLAALSGLARRSAVRPPRSGDHRRGTLMGATRKAVQ